MTDCPEPKALVEERINRVLTQYRESPKLLHLLRTYMGAVADLHAQVCDLPERFNIDTATGDQLTLVGKRMGWPRCHCVCDIDPVFGFDCGGLQLRPISGFCEPGGNWVNCDTGLSELCISDDEVYRRFLWVRSYQIMRRYDLASLESCVKIFFGNQATVLYSGEGRVVIAPGRDLTASEIALLQLYPRVLPLALGVRAMFHFGPTRVFGFGDGWGGLEEIDLNLTASGSERTNLVFGFCDSSLGGFCEEWEPEGLPISTGEDIDGNTLYLVDENGNVIYTGPLTEHAGWQCRSSAPWMCEVDVRPYDC
jgi:hypothetical protein